MKCAVEMDSGSIKIGSHIQKLMEYTYIHIHTHNKVLS
jgi:hypothetical protein